MPFSNMPDPTPDDSLRAAMAAEERRRWEEAQPKPPPSYSPQDRHRMHEFTTLMRNLRIAPLQTFVIAATQEQRQGRLLGLSNWVTTTTVHYELDEQVWPVWVAPSGSLGVTPGLELVQYKIHGLRPPIRSGKTRANGNLDVNVVTFGPGAEQAMRSLSSTPVEIETRYEDDFATQLLDEHLVSAALSLRDGHGPLVAPREWR
jgi:hypothetical protein